MSILYVAYYLDLEDTRPRHVLSGLTIFSTLREAEEHVAQCYIEDAEENLKGEMENHDLQEPPTLYEHLTELIQDNQGYYDVAAASTTPAANLP